MNPGLFFFFAGAKKSEHCTNSNVKGQVLWIKLIGNGDCHVGFVSSYTAKINGFAGERVF